MISLILAALVAALPACATEDANNCRWDASTQGNGIGTSFIVINNRVTQL